MLQYLLFAWIGIACIQWVFWRKDLGNTYADLLEKYELYPAATFIIILLVTTVYGPIVFAKSLLFRLLLFNIAMTNWMLSTFFKSRYEELRKLMRDEMAKNNGKEN